MKNPSNKIAAANLVVLGDVRTDPVKPSFNIAELMAAAKQWVPVNPGGSKGASPVIRMLLVQSGVAHTVVTEKWDDGQIHGHKGGNAVDVSADQVEPILTLLSQLAPLFACVAYKSGTRTFFIWDGAVTDPATVMGAASFLDECTGHIHIASSRHRMIKVLKKNSDVRDFLDTATPPAGWVVGSPHDVIEPPYGTQTAQAELTTIIPRRW